MTNALAEMPCKYVHRLPEQKSTPELLRSMQENSLSKSQSTMRLRHRGNSRGIVGVKTLALLSSVLVLGTSTVGVFSGIDWALYRADHLVVKEARTKGTLAELGARMDGQVEKIHVAANQRVKKGDVLVTFHQQHLEAQVKMAEAEVVAKRMEVDAERANAAQTKKELTLDIQSQLKMLAAAQADTSATDAEYKGHAKTLKRIERLLAKGAESRTRFDETLAKRDQTAALKRSLEAQQGVAEINALKAELALESLSVTDARIDALEAQIAVLEAQVDNARADLAAAQITAPSDGWVIKRLLQEGAAAQVGDPLVSIWLGDLWVEAWVKEDYLHDIPLGSTVDLSLDASPTNGLRGRVVSFGILTDEELRGGQTPQSAAARNSESAVIPVRIEILNPELLPHAQPGLSVVAGIKRGSSEADAEESAADAH